MAETSSESTSKEPPKDFQGKLKAIDTRETRDAIRQDEALNGFTKDKYKKIDISKLNDEQKITLSEKWLTKAGFERPDQQEAVWKQIGAKAEIENFDPKNAKHRMEALKKYQGDIGDGVLGLQTLEKLGKEEDGKNAETLFKTLNTVAPSKDIAPATKIDPKTNILLADESLTTISPGLTVNNINNNLANNSISSTDTKLSPFQILAPNNDDKAYDTAQSKGEILKPINLDNLSLPQEKEEIAKKEQFKGVSSAENKLNRPGDTQNDPILALKGDQKINDKIVGRMKLSEIASIDMNTIKDVKVASQILAAKNGLSKYYPGNIKNLTVEEYASYRENPLLAASKLSPNDTGELPLGFGEKGVKYRKNGKSDVEKIDHITFMYRGDKVPTVVTFDDDPNKPREVALSERFKKDGNYSLPNGEKLTVAKDTTTGVRRWFIYGKENDDAPKWVLNGAGKLEETKTT